jgi:hypothetical protein
MSKGNKILKTKWGNKEKIFKESQKYKDKKSFFKGNQSCYNAAKKMGVFNEACSHMPKNKCVGSKPIHFKWSLESIKKEALKYDTKSIFSKKSAGAYDAAVKNKWVDEVCKHMKVLKNRYTNQDLINIFKDCTSKKQAKEKNLGAYATVISRGLQSQALSHIPNRMDTSGEKSPLCKWTDQELQKIALRYKNKIIFLEKEPAAYQAAYKRKILKKICSHMKNSNDGSSVPEKELFAIISSIYPSSKKIRDMKVNIPSKPHIHGFDIDILVPELKRGIEYDGKYHHSFDGLKRSKTNWPDEDILNYHQIKDSWFAGKGIHILHIKGEDWKKDKELCIKRCLEFLGT